jgi:predicted nucleotidyltransferase
MTNYEFWSDWKRLNKLEKGGIISIKAGKKLILECVPKEEILAIYVKGSFIRREMNKYSDVDLVVILRRIKSYDRLKRISKKNKNSLEIPFQVLGYSLWELRNDKKAKQMDAHKMIPSRTVEHLEHYKLIYGNRISKEKLNSGDHKERLRRMIKVFQERHLPSYIKKNMSFHELLKQVFWLAENEQKFIGKKVPHGFKKIAKSIKDKDHIIQFTKKLYFSKSKSKEDKILFIKKLRLYLKKLGVLIKTS